MILEIKDLMKSFPKKKGEMLAIADFDLDVEEGESYASSARPAAARPPYSGSSQGGDPYPRSDTATERRYPDPVPTAGWCSRSSPCSPGGPSAGTWSSGWSSKVSRRWNAGNAPRGSLTWSG